MSKAILQSRDCWENEITPGTAHQPVRTRHTLPYTVYKVYLSSQRGLWPHLSSSHELQYTRVLLSWSSQRLWGNYFEFSSFLRETRRSRSVRRNNTTGKDLRRVFSSSTTHSHERSITNCIHNITSTRVHTVVMWIIIFSSFAAGHSLHSYSSVRQ